MTIHWVRSSSLQRCFCLVDRCTQAYHISGISFVIEGKDLGRCTVVLLRDHFTLWISFFVLFSTHCRNDDITIFACALIICHILSYIFLEWCSCNSATLVHMRRQNPDKPWYRLLSLLIGNLNESFFAVIVSSQTINRDGHGKTLLSLVHPVSVTIYIVHALPLQDVGRLVFMALHRNGCPSCHVLGCSNYVPSFPYLTKGFTASYRSTNIQGSTTLWESVSISIYCYSFG